MDARRLLILTLAAPGLSGCAGLGDVRPLETAPPVAYAAPPEAATPVADDLADAPPQETFALIEDGATPYLEAVGTVAGPETPVMADVAARGGFDGDVRVGGVQVFAWSPGRVYPVRTAPLRVTTLTLGAGETLVSKAAGDTVRWQIGETTSGAGADRRAHVLIKPLERGLDTNLVLTTSRRVYYVDLTSGGVDRFNAAVTWDAGVLEPPRPARADLQPPEAVRIPDPAAAPEGAIDARYRIEPLGRRARWTPASVFNDGLRTFIAFDPDLQIDEAPALFVIAPDGEMQMVNYRQAGGLFIVDRVFDRAELRLGDRRPQVVRIRRLQGAVR